LFPGDTITPGGTRTQLSTRGSKRLQSSGVINKIPEKEPRHQLPKVMFGDEAPILTEEKSKNGKNEKKQMGKKKKKNQLYKIWNQEELKQDKKIFNA
jgi:hypothetical protein